MRVAAVLVLAGAVAVVAVPGARAALADGLRAVAGWVSGPGSPPEVSEGQADPGATRLSFSTMGPVFTLTFEDRGAGRITVVRSGAPQVVAAVDPAGAELRVEPSGLRVGAVGADVEISLSLPSSVRELRVVAGSGTTRVFQLDEDFREPIEIEVGASSGG